MSNAAKTWRAPLVAGLAFVVAVTASLGLAHAKGSHKVHCTEDLMRVEIGIPSLANEKPQIYLEGLKGYPDERCQPLINGTLAEFRLSLSDFYECGVTRMVNQLTGKKVYYHKIIIEGSSSKEIVSVKCITTGPVYNIMMNGTGRQPATRPASSLGSSSGSDSGSNTGTDTDSASDSDTDTDTGSGSGATSDAAAPIHLQIQHHGIVRRDVLPAGFQEPEDLEITTSLTERAPEPRLSIGVNQNGKKVSGDLTVTPGTPLTMEINLDRDSAPVYGLGVNYLEVTDTRLLSETIIFKGCTVDPYLFENFNTIDGDTLSAKFKAFKFPDSSYVQFRATVNVCLDKCLGTQCSNGQVGYGRRRRRDTTAAAADSFAQALMDTNKVYEISLAMFIKINDLEGVNRNEVLQLEEKLRELKLANQRLARNSRGSFVDQEQMKSFEPAPMVVPAFVVDEKELDLAHSGSATASSIAFLTMLPLIAVFCSRRRSRM